MVDMASLLVPITDISSSAGQLLTEQDALLYRSLGFTAVTIRAVHWKGGPVTDPDWIASARNASKYNMLIIAYMVPSANNMNAQISAMRKALGDSGVQVFRILADCEDGAGFPAAVNNTALQSFCQAFDSYPGVGANVMIYGGVSWLNAHLTPALWSNRDIIYARYPLASPRPDKDPRNWATQVTTGQYSGFWPKPMPGWPNGGWQFDDDWQGPWGNTDANVVPVTFFLKGPPPTPPTPPPTVPDYNAINAAVRQQKYQRLLKDTKPLMSGKDVWCVQWCLNWSHEMFHMPELGLDGVYGPATQKNVMVIQYCSRIAVDGMVGPVTWQKLGMQL
jgi:hypothetical protein